MSNSVYGNTYRYFSLSVDITLFVCNKGTKPDCYQIQKVGVISLL